jgi:UDP-N-acetylglucosamine--N-acetylmuramyl-(pentapeptide) pyrophosphoryl-undecaprenol N-acetylglucosamine transferase
VTKIPPESGQSPCIAFTGGGTGGHVYPGLAVIECLRERWDGRIVWIGSGKEVERKAVEAAGIDFHAIPSGKLRRSLSPKNIPDTIRVISGYFVARALLKKLAPEMLFSKGGYVSVPPCLAAASLGIPVFTHESDLSPGLATRLNARSAERILVSWNKTIDWLPKTQQARTTVTGNPVRAAITAGNAAAGRAWLGFGPDLPLVLVLGGSQGAGQINTLMEAVLPDLAGRAVVAHQTGAGHLPCHSADRNYNGFEFVHEQLADLLAAADIIVGRAGAGTIWECAVNGKAMILIPLSGPDSRGDQVENAEALSVTGGALSLLGAETTPQNLLRILFRLLESKDTRDALGRAAKIAAPPGAAGAIAGMILQRIREKSQL